MAAPAQAKASSSDFGGWLAALRPQLVRSLIALRGISGAEDAAAEAIAWAWEHQARVAALEHPLGYLHRVALTRSAMRKRPLLPSVEPATMPDVEPALVPALLDLPERQRAAIWLVHACGWRHREVAEALGISPSAVATHVARAMDKLRTALHVDPRSDSAPATPTTEPGAGR